MKVALFSSTLDVQNGYGNFTYEYCSALVRQGVACTLFLPVTEARRAMKEFHDTHFNIVYALPPYIFRIKPWNILPYFKGIDLSDFDLVHSLVDFPYCVMAARLANQYHKPFIMSAHGTYGVLPLTYPLEGQLLRWAYKKAQEIVVPSEYTKKSILELARNDYPITVIHNGVNFERFQIQQDNTVLRTTYKGKKILLTVGGLKKRKGQDLVIAALPLILRVVPEACYIMVGEGERKEMYLRQAHELGVANAVKCVGGVDNTELVRYFQLCDVYIHTPRAFHYNFEGFGIVYLEAGSCKKPVIATDTGGIRDAVIGGRTGYIVSDNDVSAIAQAAITLLTNTSVQVEMGNNGHAYAAEHDWPIIVKKFLAVYRKYI